MPKTLTSFLTGLIALLWCVGAQAQYTVASLPSPKAQGQHHFVSDPDAHLSAGTVAQLDALSARIETETGAEFAVAVVDDYVGDSDFQFAMDLFTHWGIGKAGSDNGLLLFLAMERREYRFITGYGVEGILPDALLRRIGETYLVPYLRDGNVDMAVLAAAKAVQSVFLSPDHALELADMQVYQPTLWNRHATPLMRTLWVLALFAVAYAWMSRARERVLRRQGLDRAHYGAHPVWLTLITYLALLFVLSFLMLFLERLGAFYQMANLPGFAAGFGMLLIAFHYHYCNQYLAERTRDEKTRLDLRMAFTRLVSVPLLLCPLAYLAYPRLHSQRREAEARQTPPDLPGHWTRLHRDRISPDEAKKHLGPQHASEERIGARSFEIWQDAATAKIHLLPFPGAKAGQFSTCPECGGQTFGQPEVKVRQAPTRKSAGSGERVQTCRFCDHRVSLGMVVLAKLSEGSSSGSGGGGGSSSSGGSFGGGSSGGGGAGGRW